MKLQALCLICWSVTMPVAAEASKQPWVFVPVSASGFPVARASAISGAFEAAAAAAGDPLISNDDAAEQIRAYSDKPADIRSAELQTLKRALATEQSELAVYPASAERTLEGLSAPQRDALAQDPVAAQQMEAICLTRLEFEVRHTPGDAQKQASFCRSLFPTLQPEPGAYPAAVLAELSKVPRYHLRVDAPVGCAVLLNGKEVGVAPATMSAFAGPARLQLRCDGRATRVHPIVVGKQAEVAIDPALDAALHSERGLYFTGESKLLATVARWLGARVVPLYVQVVDGRIRVQLSAASANGQAARRTLWYDLMRGYDDELVTAAVTELVQAPSESPPPTTMTAGESVQRRPREKEKTSVPTGAIILGGAGVAMLAGGLVTGLLGHVRDADVRDFAKRCPAPCDPSPEQRVELKKLQSEVNTLFTATNVLVIGGGASVAAAVAWYLLWPTSGDSQVSFAPFVAPSEAGANVTVRF